MDYWVLSFYHFTNIEDPELEVKKHKKFLGERDASGRIYISERGVNGQMSAREDHAQEYMEWLKEDPRFKDVWFKKQLDKENVFPRMAVKYRKQLVAMDVDWDLAKGGEHVSPEKWRKMMESDENYLMIDVRNDYEWQLGHFDGATKPNLKTFREFPDYVDELKKEHAPEKTKVMMYCTGGIRCELYSALMKDKGFDEVYQLDGGVLNYIEKEKGKHWKGKLFVFDDRLTVDVNEEDKEIIGKCLHCGEASDHIYNCANTRCNELFVCCKACLDAFVGCCQEACMHSEHLRPYQQGKHKPFRRLHTYLESASSS